MWAALLSLLMPTLGNCQQSNPFYNSDFSGGLNTYNSSLILQQNESPDLQNVLVDRTGSLDRRQGYVNTNTTKIGDGAHDVNNIFYFQNSSGQNFCLGFSGSTGTYSTDGCNTFTIFVSTLTPGNDVNCDAFNDKAFCVNNQYNFYFNGTATTFPISSAPSDLQYIRVFNNQCFATGSTGNLSRLYYSNVNDCTTWNTTTQYIDIAPNNGDVITGIGQAFYGGLPIYKKYSTWYLTQTGSSGNGPVFQVVNISPNIGALNHRSIQTLFTEQLFDSLGPDGGQPGIYAFNGIQVYEKSKKIRGTFDKIDTFTSAKGILSFNTPTQFNSGNLCVTGPQSCLSSTEPSGYVSVSSSIFIDNSAAAFSSGTVFTNIDTMTTPGILELSSITFQSNFLNGNYNGPPAWIATGGTFDVTACSVYTDCLHTPTTVNSTIYNASTLAYGSWYFETAFSAQPASMSTKFISNGTSFSGSTGYSLDLSQSGGNLNVNLNVYPAATKICGFAIAATTIFIGWKIDRDFNGNFLVSISTTNSTSQVYNPQCSGNDNTYTTSANVILNTSNINNYWGPFNFIGFNQTGTFVSREFDTSFSTPTYGPFSSTFSVTYQNIASQVVFYVHVTTSPNNDLYDSYIASSDTLRFTGAAKRYVQYKSILTTFVSSMTPVVNAVSMVADSTGTWSSAETYTSKNMSAGGWGIFQTVQVTTGNATIAYAIKVATYSGGSQFASPVVVTPGMLITASTGDYVTVIATETVTSSSETAQFSDITLNWSQGNLTTTPGAYVYQNRYHYACQSQNGLYNDTLYVLDTNGAWFKWTDMNARSLEVVNKLLMMGGAANALGDGYIFNLYNGDTDNGGNISAYYNTKDYAFTDLSHYKSVERAIVGYASNPTTLTLDLLRDVNQQDYTYTINMSTGSALGVDYKPVNPPLNGNTFRLKFSNTAPQAPWSVLGYGMMYSDKGVMPPF